MTIELKRRLIKVEEYRKMGEVGILQENGIELIQGEILTMSPIGSNHAGTVAKLVRLLSSQLPDTFILWVQNPIQLDDYSQPEPDLAILKYREDFYMHQLPNASDILLVMEVSSSSFDFDQQVKLPLYAHAGIPHYWMFDLNKLSLICHQHPKLEQYTLIEIFDRGNRVKMDNLSLDLDLSAIFG